MKSGMLVSSIGTVLVLAIACGGYYLVTREESGGEKNEQGLHFDAQALAGAFTAAPYGRLLADRVDERGLVDYAGLRANPADLNTFGAALAAVKAGEVSSWPKKAQIAFWINAYNALTLKLIIEHLPLHSIRDIDGPWSKFHFSVAGRELTLNAIENEILRAPENAFDEPRIHVALVCAALGCPPLRAEPYSAERLDEQLQDQARRMVADERKFRIDRAAKVVRISKIFEWYGKDFIARYGAGEGYRGDEAQRAVLRFLGSHLDEPERAFLRDGDYTIEYLDYDWTLNTQ